jgi:hypothetical protein
MLAVVARSLTTLLCYTTMLDFTRARTGLGVTGRIPDEMEQSTGVERRELLELMKGNDDPFGVSNRGTLILFGFS